MKVKEYFGPIVATIDDSQKTITLRWDHRGPRPATGRLKSALAEARSGLREYQNRGYAIIVTGMGQGQS